MCAITYLMMKVILAENKRQDRTHLVESVLHPLVAAISEVFALVCYGLARADSFTPGDLDGIRCALPFLLGVLIAPLLLLGLVLKTSLITLAICDLLVHLAKRFCG